MYFCKKIKVMLKKFSVSNFKGFKELITFDLTSSNGYTFNPECVKNGIVNCGIIYGYNGCGKSNMGLAIFDIIEHLTDNYREVSRYKNYANAATDSNIVSFSYQFLIDGILVQYDYQKTDYKSLVFEKLTIAGNEVVTFDRNNENTRFVCRLQGTETLNTEISDSSLSVLKYIKNNTVLPKNEENTAAFYKFYSFVEKMLFFRSLEDRTFIGQNEDHSPLTKYIIDNNKVQEFEDFLNEGHVKCKLAVVDTLNGKDLAFDFGNKKILFTDTMSTGTSSMMLFFYWYISVIDAKISFVFIDEFDAFYHHDLAKLIIRKLMGSGVQFIVTTHNTSLMSNDLLRPDCYYLMGNNKIKPFSCCTDKELRFVHNIEKIYKGGGFYVE